MYWGVDWGWALLAPLSLSILYGILSVRAMAALGYRHPKKIRNILLGVILFTLWSAINIPLTLFYLVTFGARLFSIPKITATRTKELFLVTISYLCFVALHMTIIAATSLIVQLPMIVLLKVGSWRSFFISSVLILMIFMDVLIPGWGLPLAVLRSQADSKEVKPFLIFVRFCSIFLILDSLLCLAPLNWSLLPVLLISSAALIGFLILRILFHIYHILKVRYLEEEHERLQAELNKREQAAQELEKQSHLDPLTHVYSRRYLLDCITSCMAQSQPFSFAYLDLDRLKLVNDQLGHRAGDQYLIRFSGRLQERLRNTDVLARIGGDEFGIVFPNGTAEQAEERLTRIRDEMIQDVSWDHPMSFSFGVVHVSGESQETASQIMHRADQFMYQDKRRPQR